MKLKYNKQPLKYLSKLDKATVNRLNGALLKLTRKPPEGEIKPLKGHENCYRARIGSYRILFEIDADNEIITIREIGPRGDIYK